MSHTARLLTLRSTDGSDDTDQSRSDGAPATSPVTALGTCSSCGGDVPPYTGARRLSADNLLCAACVRKLDAFKEQHALTKRPPRPKVAKVAETASRPRRPEATTYPTPTRCPDGARWVPLGHGLYAIVDEADYARVRAVRWHYEKVGYAYHTHSPKEKWLLQRFIMDPPDEMVVTNLRLDPLDCRRRNLRVCTKAAQTANQPIDKSNTTGFKGVARSGGRWTAKITVDGEKESLGTFPDPASAARRYDVRARELYGELARYNFPRPGERTARPGFGDDQADQPRPETRAIIVADPFETGGEMVAAECACCGHPLLIPLLLVDQAAARFRAVVWYKRYHGPGDYLGHIYSQPRETASERFSST